jgi:hypothetical protein
MLRMAVTEEKATGPVAATPAIAPATVDEDDDSVDLAKCIEDEEEESTVPFAEERSETPASAATVDDPEAEAKAYEDEQRMLREKEDAKKFRASEVLRQQREAAIRREEDEKKRKAEERKKRYATSEEDEDEAKEERRRKWKLRASVAAIVVCVLFSGWGTLMAMLPAANQPMYVTVDELIAAVKEDPKAALARYEGKGGGLVVSGKLTVQQPPRRSRLPTTYSMGELEVIMAPSDNLDGLKSGTEYHLIGTLKINDGGKPILQDAVVTSGPQD